jgi:hypothetical protein
LQRVTNLEK